jgi:hypothetical protein
LSNVTVEISAGIPSGGYGIDNCTLDTEASLTAHAADALNNIVVATTQGTSESKKFYNITTES